MEKNKKLEKNQFGKSSSDYYRKVLRDESKKKWEKVCNEYFQKNNYKGYIPNDVSSAESGPITVTG